MELYTGGESCVLSLVFCVMFVILRTVAPQPGNCQEDPGGGGGCHWFFIGLESVPVPDFLLSITPHWLLGSLLKNSEQKSPARDFLTIPGLLVYFFRVENMANRERYC